MWTRCSKKNKWNQVIESIERRIQTNRTKTALRSQVCGHMPVTSGLRMRQGDYAQLKVMLSYAVSRRHRLHNENLSQQKVGGWSEMGNSQNWARDTRSMDRIWLIFICIRFSLIPFTIVMLFLAYWGIFWGNHLLWRQRCRKGCQGIIIMPTTLSVWEQMDLSYVS